MVSFNIPFHSEDLLTQSSAGQYVVEEVFSTRLLPIKIQNAKVAFAKDGGLAILEHFDALYSVISRFSNLDSLVRKQSWEIVIKSCQSLSNILGNLLCGGDETDTPTSPRLEQSVRMRHQNALKMNVYVMVQMADLFQGRFNQRATDAAANSASGRSRKAGKMKAQSGSSEVEWIEECEKMTRLLMGLIDLEIHRLWEPELVEDEFINLITNLCYKMLESQALVRINEIKEPAFHLLGCLIKKHNQTMSAGLKLVQLLQHFNHLASPLAEAVTLWQNTYKCKTIVCEVMREIGRIPEKDFLRDSESTRTLSLFLQDLARQCSAGVLANFSLILNRMNEDSYVMRSTVLSMMGEIILQSLSGEGLDDKAKLARDQFLDFLYDHANLDPNAFTRSKAIQIWINLVREQALPIKRYPDLVELCSSLLLDRSNLVRKFTIQLLEGILRFNPFASKLPIDILQTGLDEAKEKLEEMMKEAEESNMSSGSEKADDRNTEDNVNQVEDEVFADEGLESASQDVHENPDITKQKDIVSYLSDSVRFVHQFFACVPVLCDLLRSHTHSDITEAISFFTAAWEFKLSFALVGITTMLHRIWHEEAKIREAVVSAYKQLYFRPEGSTPKARASCIADNLMSLVSVSPPGKLKSLEALLHQLSKSGDIPPGVAHILWDRFAKPELNNSSATNMLNAYEQQKLSVQLLGFLAGTNPDLVKSKIDILVNHGLKIPLNTAFSSETVDFSLSLHSCVALGQLRPRKTAAGEYEKSLKLSRSHEMFSCIQQLITRGFSKKSENWEHFATEAIGLIYDIAEGPDILCEEIFRSVLEVVSENEACDNTIMKQMFLTRFFLLCGHIAIKELVYLEESVLAEMKHRRRLTEEKEEKVKKEGKSRGKRRSVRNDEKAESNLEEDMGVGGATADDQEQEFIRNVTENELLAKDSLLGQVSPLLVRACLIPVRANKQCEVAVQATASVALAKCMQICSQFCESHLQLLFTLLEKSPHEIVRANLVIPVGDLCVRFPNVLEPWTAHLYARLKDESSLVRIYSVKVLSNLILNDMVKVKGHVSEMARCTVDSNEQIASLAKKFFQDLAKKGNSIYNVMPDIISRLSDPEVGIPCDEQFQIIMRFLFSFIQKDKQSESLVEKLCHRFSATRTKRQWRDLSFCLSLLTYSEKSVRRLQENFTCIADKLSDEQVYQSFIAVIAKTRKFSKPDLKIQIDELETLIDECHQKGVSDDQTAAKAAAVVKKSRRLSSIRSPRANIAWPSNSQVDDKPKNPTTAGLRHIKKKHQDDVDSESEDDFQISSVPGPKLRRPATRRTTQMREDRGRIMNFSSDEEDEIEGPVLDQEEKSIDSDNSTPIRRKKTPKRLATISKLRA